MKPILIIAIARDLYARDILYPEDDYINCECDTRVTTVEKNMTIHWGGDNRCVYGT